MHTQACTHTLRLHLRDTLGCGINKQASWKCWIRRSQGWELGSLESLNSPVGLGDYCFTSGWLILSSSPLMKSEKGQTLQRGRYVLGRSLEFWLRTFEPHGWKSAPREKRDEGLYPCSEPVGASGRRWGTMEAPASTYGVCVYLSPHPEGSVVCGVKPPEKEEAKMHPSFLWSLWILLFKHDSGKCSVVSPELWECPRIVSGVGEVSSGMFLEVGWGAHRLLLGALETFSLTAKGSAIKSEDLLPWQEHCWDGLSGLLVNRPSSLWSWAWSLPKAEMMRPRAQGDCLGFCSQRQKV